ncbi:hypothetical protein BKA65DRAFT_516739 [Rhexocercosporidium sp. MPI-PUGE-AT-0058]|nr:hypothetical protein BKA65DRAFT_516739 [Rhexocercosporidium sp. MPI-PUGE-AT-0058]
MLDIGHREGTIGHSWQPIFSFLLLNLGLFLVYNTHTKSDNAQLKLPWNDWIAPAVEMELRPWDDLYTHHYSPFRGPPRPELDAAWQDMVANSC